MRWMQNAAWRKRGGLLSLALGAMALAGCASGAGAATLPNALSGLDSGQLEALGRGLGAVNAMQGGAGQGIKVTGTGVVKVEPELGVLSVGVEEAAPSVAQARAAAAESMNAMLAALRETGVSDEDMETQRFQIRAEYQRIGTEQRLTGFRVTNTLTVKVRDLDSVGDVIDRVAEAGGNATRINNIHFTIEEGGAAADEARRLALRNAVSKADLYAKEIGLTRGALLSLNETSRTQFPEMAFFASAAMDFAASTPIQPGELDVTVMVEAVFSIQ